MGSAVNQSPGGCNCGFSVTFRATGCGGLSLPGAEIKIWRNSGKTELLGSGITNGDGEIVLRLPSTGTYYREMARERFVDDAEDISIPASPGTITKGMTRTSDYVCFPGCAVPIAKTLHWRDSYGGYYVLAHSVIGGVDTWKGSGLGDFPAGEYGTCGARTDVPCEASMTPAETILNYRYLSSLPGFNCPSSGGNAWRASAGSTKLESCAPSLLISRTAYALTPYFGMTVAITET